MILHANINSLVYIMRFMKECARGIGKGQGEFTRQFVADGGQKLKVNNLKGELTAYWQEDDSGLIHFTNLVCQRISCRAPRAKHDLTFCQLCRVPCSCGFARWLLSKSRCDISGGKHNNCSRLPLSDERSHRLILVLSRLMPPPPRRPVVPRRNKAVCHAINSIVAHRFSLPKESLHKNNCSVSIHTVYTLKPTAAMRSIRRSLSVCSICSLSAVPVS